MFRSSLFGRGNIDDYFIALREKMCGEIDRIPAEEIVRADAEQLSSGFMEKYQVACPVLGDDISYDEPPLSPRSDTIIVQVQVPFTGNHELFQCTGGTAPIITQKIQVQLNQLVIPLQIEPSRIGEVPQRVFALLKRIRDGLLPIEQKLKYLNPDLKRWALGKIQERQRDLASHERMLSDLQKSGFTLRRRNDGNEKVIVPVKPKVIAIQPKPSPFKSEPELSLPDYDEILNVIQAMAKVCERSPSVFKAMKEEDLRSACFGMGHSSSGIS